MTPIHNSDSKNVTEHECSLDSYLENSRAGASQMERRTQEEILHDFGVSANLQFAIAPHAMAVALRTIRDMWPDCIVKDLMTENIVQLECVSTATPHKHLQVFMNSNALRSWDEAGADPDTAHTRLLLHITEERLVVEIEPQQTPELLFTLNKFAAALTPASASAKQ